MDNTCENCRFFIKYYVLSNSIRLVYAGCGKCLNDNLTKKESQKNFKKKCLCPYWETETKRIEDQKATVIGNLKLIKQQMDGIFAFLQLTTPPDEK